MDVRRQAAEYFERFRELPIFARKVRGHWYDAVAGATATGVAIILVSAIFSLSHYWLLLILLVAFCPAAYMAWRDEYAPYELVAEVEGPIDTSTDTIVVNSERQTTLTIRLTLSIRNSGNPTMVDNWKLEFPQILLGVPIPILICCPIPMETVR
jgi:hypothetical protein